MKNILIIANKEKPKAVEFSKKILMFGINNPFNKLIFILDANNLIHIVSAENM